MAPTIFSPPTLPTLPRPPRLPLPPWLQPPPAVPPLDLDALRFRAETDPLGPAVDLVWELPDPAAAPDALPLRILRLIRRFPGRSRRGIAPVQATPDDLADGRFVYDSASVQWDIEETTREDRDGAVVATTRQFQFRGSPRDRVLVRTIRREFRSGSPAPHRTTVRYVDRADLAPATIYYYTAFAGMPRWFSRRTQSSALATGSSGPRLFPLLPRVDQERDDTAPDPRSTANSEHGRGQLERFVRTAEPHGDMLLGFVDALRDLHDVRRVDSRLLEAMAAQIGWQFKDYLSEEGQRNEISFAPEVHRTTGTPPNVAAMVNRLTGWAAEVRDFSRSVLLTWDRSRVEQLESGPAYLDGSTRVEGNPPVLVTRAVPRGSVNTTDVAAMFRLRNGAFEDTTAFTYDFGRPDAAEGGYARDDSHWYNRETLGVYAAPDVPTAPLVVQQTWERVRQILAGFLPIQVRPVLFIRPGVVVETPYDATQVQEVVTTLALLSEAESWDTAADTLGDRIRAWRWLITNDIPSRSVDTTTVPVDVSRRTRHVGVTEGP